MHCLPHLDSTKHKTDGQASRQTPDSKVEKRWFVYLSADLQTNAKIGRDWGNRALLPLFIPSLPCLLSLPCMPLPSPPPSQHPSQDMKQQGMQKRGIKIVYLRSVLFRSTGEKKTSERESIKPSEEKRGPRKREKRDCGEKEPSLLPFPIPSLPSSHLLPLSMNRSPESHIHHTSHITYPLSLNTNTQVMKTRQRTP